MVCYIMPAKDDVTFGSYGGEDLPDPRASSKAAAGACGT